MDEVAGKGDSYRPVNRDVYDANFDKVFGRCSTHPQYKVIRQPTADCIVCRRLWREAQLRKDQ